MRYEHVVEAVFGSVWAILPEKLREIASVVAFRASGQEFTAEEIQARVGSKQPPVTAGRGIGVLAVHGTISHRMGTMAESSGGVSAERLTADLRALLADDTIGTILLDIDSPGGTVTGVPELAAELYAARDRKRIVALVNGLAASAAYWLAAQAHEIVSIPTGMAGSIGVYTAHEDLSAALEKNGVKVTVISAGKHKVDGSPFEPLSDEHRAFMQDRVNEFYGLFIKDVARGRGASVADVRNGYGEGRTLLAKDAKAAGLIDRIDTVDDTLRRLLRRSSSSARAELTPEHIAAEAARLEAF